MKHVFTHAILSLTILLSGCKTVGSRDNELSGLAPSSRASDLHKDIVADLTQKFPASQGKVWFESTMQLQPDWLIQSPEGVWGRVEATFPKKCGLQSWVCEM